MTSLKKTVKQDPHGLSKVEAPTPELEEKEEKNMDDLMDDLKKIEQSVLPVIKQLKELSEDQIDFIIVYLISQHPQKAFDNICMTVAHETIYLKKDISETKKILFSNMDKGITDIYNGTKDRLHKEMEKKDDKS